MPADPASGPLALTDPDDPRLAPFRDLRDHGRPERAGCFVAETREVVRQVLAAGRFTLRTVLTTPSGVAALGPLPAGLVVLVAPLPLVKAVVGFDFHRGCVAVGDRGTDPTLAQVLATAPRRLLVLDDVTNPDNVGGLFRNARAFGAGAVLLSSRTLDPLHRKVIRVSIGATLAVPFTRLEPWEEGLAALGRSGVTRVALVSAGGVPPARLGELRGPVALLLGNEGTGLRPASLAAADLHVTVPMAPGVDSLNVSVACGIALERLAC